MEGIKPPSGLQLSGEGANFARFVQSFHLYIEALGLDEESDGRKIALFLNCAGEDAIEIYNTFDKSKIKTLQLLLEAFRDYCEPRKSLLWNTYNFLITKQEEGETFEHFYTRVRNLAKKGELGDLEERLITLVIVIGIRDNVLKERLLQEHDLKLKIAVQICRAAELGKEQVQKLNKTEHVDVVKKFANTDKYRGARPKEKMIDCNKCGKSHEIRNCPAFGRRCAICGIYNHFASMCRNKNANKATQKSNLKPKRRVNTIQEDSEESEQEFSIGSVITVDGIKTQWQEMITINGTSVNFKLDTGADCNTLPLELYNKIKKKNDVLVNNKTVLIVYNGEKIKTSGYVELTCVIKGQKINLKFTVIDMPVQPVLGLPDCSRLGLVKRINSTQLSSEKEKFVKDNKEIFTGLGTIGKYTIRVKDDSEPVIKPIRRVPQAIKDKLKETLDNYEKRNIIEKVTHPTNWCNNLVIVEKPDKSLRLCLDPQELNKNILRENYPITSPEEIYNSLSGKQVFTVLDMKDGFFQIELDDPQKLCTFGTPFGRYTFKRMPFGISSAPEVMQRMNCTIFGDIEGVYIYFDDIIIAGKSESEHDLILKKVVERAKQHNVRFNSKKLQYKRDHVKYVGLIISKEGIQVDSEHVAAILQLEPPKNLKQLQKFLGMCNYLSKFIPHYSKTTEPLRLLLKKDTVWEWGSLQQEAFLELKQKLSCTPTLAILSNKGTVVLQTDSSKSGMGACLLQDGKPVSFYSRCYTECQNRWAPIEKELFAICAAMEKYHQFVYGRKIIIETDHKPLVAIMSKDINKISARLQRMVLKLLKYDFDIRYVPGTKMYIADYLSRNYITNNAVNDTALQELVHSFEAEFVYGFESELPVSDEKMKQLQVETGCDKNLKQIMTWYFSEWPASNKNITDKDLNILFKLKDFINVKDDIVYYKNRIVIPMSMRKEILNIVHSAHAGVVKCKKRARRCLFWPGMSGDIENFVLSCKDCERYRPSNAKETLMSHEIPDIPFYKVGMDICSYGAKDYLVLIDYYSKWIELKSLDQKTAKDVILKLKVMFATHGIPKYAVCDNNPFNSFEFKQFAREVGMQLLFSSPHHHQSNGLAEKAVGIVKNMMKKCKQSGDSLNMALLHYRTTPLAGLEYSPSELLMSRLLRTNLPCTYSALKPKLPVNVKAQLQILREKSEKNYNKTAKTRSALYYSGQNVLIQNGKDKAWQPGQVIKKQGPRSYVVQNERGNFVRRNEKHITKSRSEFDVQISVPESLTTEHRQSRSGRVVKPPAYLNDYVM